MASIKGHRKLLGVDIGGSSIKFCLIDGRSKSILDTNTVPHTSGTSTDEIILEIMNQIEEWKFVGSLGIGFPGIVDKMVIVDAPNLGHSWNGFDFKTHFAKHGAHMQQIISYWAPEAITFNGHCSRTFHKHTNIVRYPPTNMMTSLHDSCPQASR